MQIYVISLLISGIYTEELNLMRLDLLALQWLANGHFNLHNNT